MIGEKLVLIPSIMKKKERMGGYVETAIIVALITGGCSVLGVILSNISSNNKIAQMMQTNQAVTEIKIQELTREVREHNNFAKRMPVVEEQIRVINHRLNDLEKGA